MKTDSEIREELLTIDEFGLIRKFMSKQEIRVANKMVKEGLLYKGKTIEKPHSVVYFTN